MPVGLGVPSPPSALLPLLSEFQPCFRSVGNIGMWVEHTARSEDNAFDAESNSSADSAQSYENSTTMSGNQSQTQSPEQPSAGVTHKEETHREDFATALESYTLETEPAPSEDNVFKGTVIKITATHVVVDIGFKSEGLVPIAEVT